MTILDRLDLALCLIQLCYRPIANPSTFLRSGYMLANNAMEPSMWQHMAKDPARIKQFAGSMKALATGTGNSLHHLVQNYPWTDIGSGIVVDLGGSTGAAAFAVAEKQPDIHFIVQDLPSVVSEAKERPGVNVTFQAHSFMEEQPVKGANVYMSRWCFRKSLPQPDTLTGLTSHRSQTTTATSIALKFWLLWSQPSNPAQKS